MSSDSQGSDDEQDAPVFYGHEQGRSYLGYEMPFSEPVITPDDNEYHTFFPTNSILAHRYQIKKLIGKGTFCLVWLALDLLEKRNVAIKVLKKENQEDAEYIINLYLSSMATEFNNLVYLYSIFFHGLHCCLVFQLACQNILTFISYFDSPRVCPPMSLIKKISFDVLNGLKFLHENGVIHTDLKPENVLSDCPLFPLDNSFEVFEKVFNPLEDDPMSIKFLLTDLGNSCFVDLHTNNLIQTRQYRAPEILLRMDYDCSTDIWSLGCMIFELCTRRHLFNPEINEGSSGGSDDGSPIHDALHLMMIDSVVGPIPRDWAMNGEVYEDFFDDDGQINCDVKAEISYHSIFERLIQHLIPEADARDISCFIEPMLQIVPACRPSAADLLESPWLNII